MKHSIRVKIVTICVGMLIITLIGLWALNNFFLEDFYCSKKTEAFTQNFNEIDKMIEENINSTLITMKLQRMRDTDNIAYLQVSSEGDWTIIKYSTSPTEQKQLLARLQTNLIWPSEDRKIIHQEDSYTIQKIYNQEMKSFYLECYGFFRDGSSFIMSTPLESIKDSVVISNQFLIQVGFVLLIISAIAIYMVTKHLTQPILTLAEISSRMANLDFNVRYEGNQKGELEVLGNSMNHMADKLQQTIHKLQAANEQLKQDIEEKVQIDEMRKEFLSNVSHELKTPIALIQGYAEGLQEVVNEDPESQDYYCEVIIDEADKMNKMVQKLLTLNHLEFGQEEWDMEVFDIVELVNSVIGTSGIMIQQKEAKVSIESPASVLVYSDEFKTEEVVTNYFTNAINHLDYAREITVRIFEVQEDKVHIEVHNTGDPIPEEDLDKVWIKFYKVDKARTRAYGGSGIGLSIVKAIMDSLHQNVGVRNEDGGVTFWFELQKGKESKE